MTDFNALSDADLQSAKYTNQAKVYSRNGAMWELSRARSNVKAINAILRSRGLLVDAKAKAATEDSTGLVAAAIAPHKAAAMDYVEQQARENIATVVNKFAGQDLNLVAPRPNSMRMGRIQYRSAQARRSFILSILSVAPTGSTMPGQPEMLVRNEANEARYVASERHAAGVSFDAYVAKLEGKVGQGVTAATVTGRLWQGSVLTVTKGAVVEKWHTQQIINRSVLGNLFNQWPTRVVK